MDRRDTEPNRQPSGSAGDVPAEDWREWAEVFARTVANLAAQLTVTQLQLRALGREVEARGLVEPGAVQARLRRMAPIQTGSILRENLGETLSEIVDVAALERDLIDYLTAPGADHGSAG